MCAPSKLLCGPFPARLRSPNSKSANRWTIKAGVDSDIQLKTRRGLFRCRIVSRKML